MFSLFDSTSILPLHLLYCVFSSELFVRTSLFTPLPLSHIHFFAKFGNQFIHFFLIRNPINLPLDSILLISPSFLQKRLKIESLELFVVLHRELSYLEIKILKYLYPLALIAYSNCRVL